MQREDAPAKNLHRIIWVANKVWGWIQISNLFELSNLHRTLNFRTYSVMKYRKVKIAALMFRKIPKKFGQHLAKSQQNSGKF